MLTIAKFRRINRILALIALMSLLVLILPLYTTLSRPSRVTEAAWYDDTYSFRQKITFTHNADITGDRRISITIANTNTLITNGQMQSDCDDSRFTDLNGKLLRFQLVSGCNSATAVYDVVFPTVNNGDNIAYFYYDNPSAISASESQVSLVTSLTPSGSPTTGSAESSPGPISYWPMSEGTGTSISDATAQSNTLTITNAVWRNQEFCIVGNCLYFDGSGDYALKTYSSDLELAPGTGSFTVSAWFRATSTAATTRTIISRADGVNGVGYKLYLNTSGNACFGIDGAAGSFPSDAACTTTNLADNTWHFITAVKTGTTSITIYIDGQAAGSDPAITGSSISGTNADFRIGIDTDNSTNPWTGSIDEVKYFNFARTPAQVTTDFASRGSAKGVATQVGASQNLLSSGLVGYWKTDETSGNASDASGNGTTLTDGSSTTYAAGKFGNGADLELGSTDYLYAADNTTLSLTGSLTISAWVRPESVTAATQFDIAGKWDGASESYLLSQYGDEIRIYLDASSNYVETGINLAVSTWYHVAAVYESTSRTAKIYINGTEVPTQLTGTIPSSIGDDAGRFHIGAEDSTTATTNYYDGIVDEVRLYNRALGSREISQLADWAPGPVGWWKFDENTGISAADASGNGLTATLNNNATWGIGQFGSALHANGTAACTTCGYASIADITLLRPRTITMSAWFKLTSSPNTSEILSKAYNAAPWSSPFLSWLMRVNTSTQLEVDVGNGSTYSANTISVSALQLQRWYHLAATYDGTSLRTYLNGSLIDTDTVVSGDIGYAAQPVLIGASYGSSPVSSNFPGLIDDVRIYNYPRTHKQIIEDMNASHPAGGSPVGSQIIWWKFEENTVPTVYNSVPGQTALTGTTNGVGISYNTSIEYPPLCYLGGCIVLNAAADYIDAGDVSFVDGLQGLSISAWLYPRNALTTNRSIVSKNNTGQKNFAITTDATNADEIRVHIADAVGEADNTNYYTTTNFDMSLSTWFHMGVVYDATKPASERIKVYKNGKLINGTYTGTIPSDGLTSGSTSSLRLGDDESGTYSNMNYNIDEFKIYPYALNHSEMAIDANAGAALSVGVLSSDVDRGFQTITPQRWWKFDDNTGIATSADSSSLEGTATINGVFTESQWQPGKLGSAIVCNGTNNYISENTYSIANSDAFSVSLWFKSTSTSRSKMYTEGNSGGGTSQRLFLAINENVAGDAEFCIVDDSNVPSCINPAGVNLSDNRWHHMVAIQRSKSEREFFIDGISQGADTTTIGTVTINRLTMCANRGSSLSDYFNGLLDDVRVYNVAISVAQVQNLYNQGSPVAWWKFDECQGSTVYDQSVAGSGLAGGKNGTINAGAGGNTAAGSCGSGVASDIWNDGTTGKYSASLGFDGTDDYVAISDNNYLDITSSVTFSAWIDPNGATGAVEPIISKGTTVGNFNYLMTIGTAYGSGSRLNLQIQNTAGISGITPIQNFSGWIHVAGVWDGTKCYLYLNGLLDTSSACSGTPGTNALDVHIGRYDTNYFNGLIDDVQIYRYALSDSQVKQVYNQRSLLRFGPSTGSP